MFKGYTDEEIRILEKMKTLEPESPEYKECMDRLAKFKELQKQGLDLTNPEIIKGIFGLAGILMVLRYEHIHVITSKAFSMIRRI